MNNAYERNKARAREQSRLRSLDGRDVAPLPAIADLKRRKQAKQSLLFFCREYFPKKFKKPFGANHYALIDALQTAIVDGGKQAIAMPRGTGKTTISNVAVVWALLNGHRRFVVIFAATTKEARKILRSILTMISRNEALRRDYPEICVPLAKLNGSALLARGQLFYGVPTDVQISADVARFPVVPGSPASGSTVAAYGIGAAVRGQSAELPDGATARPDFLFLDDVQTDAIALNPRRVEKMEDVVASTLDGLAENGGEISMIQTITVKFPGDLADRFLNREIYPRWNGLRFASLPEMPSNMKLWREYRGIWFEDEKEATRFYRAHLDEMRAGAVVSWPDAYSGRKYVDALEYYMVKWCENERAFWSEQQNRPLELSSGAVKLAAKAIAKKLNGIPRGVVPAETVRTTAFVDVHDDVLYYAICAFAPDFTGAVVDYGTFPEQRRPYFSKSDGGLETLRDAFPGNTKDGRIKRGLTFLFNDLTTRTFPVDGDETKTVPLDLVLTDSRYKTAIVEAAARPFGLRRVYPARGWYFGAKSTPMRRWPKRPGRVFGWRWVDETSKGRNLRVITADTNYWKTATHEAFALEPGESGSLTLFGDSAKTHRMISEHIAAETATLVTAAERAVWEWTPKPTAPDNHFFDCVYNCLVAASTLGLETPDERAARRE